MTREEFNRWWDDFKIRFPTTINWLAADHKPEALKLMISSWAETLADVDLADALEASKGMQSGRLEDWGRNSDRIPAMVRRHARDLGFARGRVEEPAVAQPARGGNGLRTGEMIRYVAEALRTKLPKSQWLARALSIMGNVPKEREPRYRCPDCRDTGFMDVWHHDAVSAFKRGAIATYTGPKTSVCVCSVCRGSRDGMPSFSAVFCRQPDGGKSDRDLAALESFCASALSHGGSEWQG